MQGDVISLRNGRGSSRLKSDWLSTNLAALRSMRPNGKEAERGSFAYLTIVG